MEIFIISKGKKVFHLANYAYIKYSPIPVPLPREGDTLRYRITDYKDFDKEKGYPIYDYEYMVESVIHDYRRKEIYLNSKKISEKKTYQEVKVV